MKYNEGYVYHIKDSYFTKANDDKLMENKESGKYRPTYYCFKDVSVNSIDGSLGSHVPVISSIAS